MNRINTGVHLDIFIHSFTFNLFDLLIYFSFVFKFDVVHHH